ncbi:MAG: sensor histidine kinase [Gemmiger sp.]
MEHNKVMRGLRGLMIALNLVLILYYALLRFVTPLRICRTFAAHDFLAAAGHIQDPPWMMLFWSLLLYIPLVVLMLWKDHLPPERRGTRMAICVAEVLLCIGEVISLDFYYRDLLLMVVADLVFAVQGKRFRVGIVAALIPVYAFSDYEIAQELVASVPFRQYLTYYEAGISGWLSGVESLMLSYHTLLFITFMVLLFTQQMAEKDRIQQLNDQLHESNRKLQEYALKTERMTELRERNRLAREIHDTLGHTLTGIIMTTDAGLVLLDAAPQDAKKQFRLANEVARDGLNDVRRSIQALRPDALEQKDFAQALAAMIEKFRRTTSAQVVVSQQAGPLCFAADEEDTVYRVVQESLTNAVRHGKASRIDLRFSRSGDVLTIDVRDNGIGLQPDAEEGFGLRHMRERIDLLHGILQFGNRPAEESPSGFYLTVTLPLRAQEKEVQP